MQVRLISKTTGAIDTEYENQTIDSIVAGIARISSSREVNELFKEPHKLIRHCLLEGHFSVFEMANLTFEIKTSRAMGREIIRHGKLAGLQEFSQRYQPMHSYEYIELREQSKNNRQSSTEVIDASKLRLNVNGKDQDAESHIDQALLYIHNLYQALLEAGVAKECSRFLLSENTSTTIIMNFRIRELITFLNARLHNTAQKEVRFVAEAIKDIFIQECSVISKALYNFQDAYNIHILERLVLEKYKVYKQVRETIIK